MTKEEAKHLSEVAKAYSEGKIIQFYDDKKKWIDLEGQVFFTHAISRYRIKPENKIRPYKNAEEFLKAYKEHGPFVKDNRPRNKYTNVNYIYDDCVILNTYICNYDVLIKFFKWQDGTPCGVIE